jgi:hypothetical protein
MNPPLQHVIGAAASVSHARVPANFPSTLALLRICGSSLASAPPAQADACHASLNEVHKYFRWGVNSVNGQ